MGIGHRLFFLLFFFPFILSSVEWDLEVWADTDLGVKCWGGG